MLKVNNRYWRDNYRKRRLDRK